MAREKNFMKEKDEKKANAEQKKKNVPDRRREKETRKVFSTTPFFVLSFPNQNPRQRERASFCASSFFFLLARSIHSSHFSLVARARVYIYIYLETRDLDAFHSRDETRKRERRKENDVHERRRSRRKKGRGRKKDRIVFSERSFE